LIFLLIVFELEPFLSGIMLSDFLTFTGFLNGFLVRLLNRYARIFGD
jgi:hypothetical protein